MTSDAPCCRFMSAVNAIKTLVKDVNRVREWHCFITRPRIETTSVRAAVIIKKAFVTVVYAVVDESR